MIIKGDVWAIKINVVTDEKRSDINICKTTKRYVSKESWFLENLLIVLPSGVVSKNKTGAKMIWHIAFLCIFLAALMPIITINEQNNNDNTNWEIFHIHKKRN
jgi:hypothetical protein